jgi:surface antigen
MTRIFDRRLNAPGVNNKYYIKTTYKGYNKCAAINLLSGSVLPNCTGYAWGRFCECQGETVRTCKLSTGDAGNWYYKNDGYKRGNTPKLGAVICWSDIDGAGHVAIVEKVEDNGDILTSNSAYKGKEFFLKTIKKSKGYSFGYGYTFQGFIYNPTEFIDPDTPIPPDEKSKKHIRFNWPVFIRPIRKRHLTDK